MSSSGVNHSPSLCFAETLLHHSNDSAEHVAVLEVFDGVGYVIECGRARQDFELTVGHELNHSLEVFDAATTGAAQRDGFEAHLRGGDGCLAAAEAHLDGATAGANGGDGVGRRGPEPGEV